MALSGRENNNRFKPRGDLRRTCGPDIVSLISNTLGPYLFPFRRNIYVDKATSGFLLWKPQLKGYLKVPEGDSPITWEQASQAVLETLGTLLDSGEIYSQLVTLWAQESSQTEGKPDIRNDHVQFTKSLGNSSCRCCRTRSTLSYIPAKAFEDRHLDTVLESINPLLIDPDRFKQRAGAEVLVGLLRGKGSDTFRLADAENCHLGSKHWPKQKWDRLWTWTMDRIDQIFVQIKPDTLSFWKSVFSVSIFVRPQPLVRS